MAISIYVADVLWKVRNKNVTLFAELMVQLRQDHVIYQGVANATHIYKNVSIIFPTTASTWLKPSVFAS